MNYAPRGMSLLETSSYYYYYCYVYCVSDMAQQGSDMKDFNINKCRHSHGTNHNIYIFPWWQLESTGGVCYLDVDSGSFLWDIGTLMWLSDN